MKKYFKNFYEWIKFIIHNISSLEKDDWYRLGFFSGMGLIILAKPISFFHEIASIIVYLIGVVFFSISIYLSYKSD